MTAKGSSLFVLMLSLILSFSACRTVSDYPKYDQVLVYDRPYDVTYLRTLEALNKVPGWTLEETDKEKGLVVVRNTQYGHLFDKDKWVGRFRVTRVNREQTSVALDETSQTLKDGGLLLERIDEMMKATALPVTVPKEVS